MGPGDVLADRFEIHRRVGAGGMGAVFRAQDRTSGQPVAVKVLLHESPTATQRFAREVQVLADLSHPGIVRHIDHGTTDSGESYLVMEWLEGEDLASRLARRGLTIAESIEVATQVASALATAHAGGVIHRDIKPSNLFLVGEQTDRVKLLDFGLARFDKATIMTQEGALLGTPSYMAPEQARGITQIDGRADVFSLGCVLFECLTGERAFSGQQVMATLAKILFAEARSVRELQPTIPREIDELVTWMLAKHPESRPRDGAELFNALAALGSMPGLSGSASVPHSLRSAPRMGRGPAKALTNAERRSIGMILIGEDRSGSAGVADPDFVQEVESLGGAVLPMLNGSALVTLSADGVATDLAGKSASLALLLRQRVGDRAMALSMSRSDGDDWSQTAGTIDVTASLLEGPAGLDPARARGPAPIYLDDVTAGLLDARFDVRESGFGFVLHGERAVAEAGRTLLGKPTACVGRDREIGLLERIFEECVDERAPQAVLITGQAGMGKSRLAHEFVRAVRRTHEGVAVWIGRADSLRAGSTFGLLGQALRSACGLLDGEALEQRRAKLRARVAWYVPSSEQPRIREFLGEIVGTPLPDHDSVALRSARTDAQLMGDQMRMAWEDFVAAQCTAGPLILVLEDLHWGDSATVRFVESVLRRRNLPFMVVAMARPEVHERFPKLWAERAVQEIRLRELTARAAERLVRQVLDAEVSAAQIERIIALADGNAFYLEELIRATVEREDEGLPDTVVAMVQSRLAALGGRSRRILRAASVFGESAWSGGIAALLGDDDEDSGEGISELVEREVLLRRPASRFAGQDEFAFRHALLREGAYGMLTEVDRMLGHRLAGTWLEQHGESEALVLAEHFERGGQLERAGIHYLHAAELITVSGDSDATRTLVLKGLECGVTGSARLALLGVYCEVSLWRANFVMSAVPHAREVLRVAAPGGGAWAQALTTLSMSHLHLGDVPQFVDTMGQLASDVPIEPDAAGSICLGLAAGFYFLESAGQLELARHFVQRGLAIGVPRIESGPLAAAWVMGMEGLQDGVIREDPFRGLHRLRRAIQYVERVNHRRGVAAGRVSLGCLLWSMGAFDEATREFDDIAIPDSELGLLSGVRPFTRVALLSHHGAHDQAIAVAKQLHEGSDEHPLSVARGHWAHAHALLGKGALVEAEREIQTALRLLAALRVEYIGASATAAAIELAAGRAERALDIAASAMAEYRTIGACGFMRGPYLRVVHIEALLATGREHEAREAIAIAHEHLLVLADRIGDPGYRQSFLEVVPENVRILELAGRRERG